MTCLQPIVYAVVRGPLNTIERQIRIADDMSGHAARIFDRKEAIIIVNPSARKLPKRARFIEADQWLRAHGWSAEWVETAGPGDATGLATKAAKDGVPLLLVCGGDGTLNEAVNGLAGTETAMAVIPAGTVNLWAREVGLMKRPVEAVRLAVEGVRRRVDLGRAGERYFLLMAGYGVDAAVAHRVSHGIKGRLGAAAYALSAARQAMVYRSSRIDVTMDGERRAMNVLQLIAGNTRNYAGLTQVTREALVDDGRLDLCVYEGRSRWDILWLSLLTLLGRHGRSRKVTQRRVERLELTWQTPLLAQLDGEAIAESPVEVTVAPAALWVMTPRGLKSPLFSRPP
jgi:YegS/Rv2252/BmrU family lipid kinase